MRTILAALALATPLVSYASAIPDVHTSTLNLTSISDYSNSTALTVLSDQGGATKVTTAAWRTMRNIETDGGFANYDDYRMSMTFAPAAGYVITGYSISAYASGILKPAVRPPEANGSWKPGVAENRSSIYLPDGRSGLTFKEFDDITTPTLLEFGVQGLSIDRATEFHFETAISANAAFGNWWDNPDGWNPTEHRVGSYAQIAFKDPTLTIYTALAPVPEPETWAMLLAGIVLVGVAKRRNKR